MRHKIWIITHCVLLGLIAIALIRRALDSHSVSDAVIAMIASVIIGIGLSDLFPDGHRSFGEA